MAMHPAGLRRNFKNIVHNYSEAQVKVREATSNDPWGPSSTLMCEIADLTYNVVAFSEIMQVVWKRLNDHGKNWRHVYKALVLLEYLIKTGTEKVGQQCKENIFAIQTLKDFQHTEENKDHGIHVREKAKQLVGLLKDDERLKNERARALKAKERFAQSSTGFGSDSQGPFDNSNSRSSSFGQADGGTAELVQESERERRISTDLESAGPHTAGEEELQLQLALAMSKEEADQEEQRKRSDDVRLQMAITQSAEDFSVSPGSYGNQNFRKVDAPLSHGRSQPQPALLDLLDVSVGTTSPSADPWGVPVQQSGGSALHAFCASKTDSSSSQWPPSSDNSSLDDFHSLRITENDQNNNKNTPSQNLQQESEWIDTPMPGKVTNSTLESSPWGNLIEGNHWNDISDDPNKTLLENTPSPNSQPQSTWVGTPMPDYNKIETRGNTLPQNLSDFSHFIDTPLSTSQNPPEIHIWKVPHIPSKIPNDAWVITPTKSDSEITNWKDTPIPGKLTNQTWNNTPSPNLSELSPWKDTPIPGKLTNQTWNNTPSPNLTELSPWKDTPIPGKLANENDLTLWGNVPSQNSSIHTPVNLQAWVNADWSKTPIENTSANTSSLTQWGNDFEITPSNPPTLWLTENTPSNPDSGTAAGKFSSSAQNFSQSSPPIPKFESNLLVPSPNTTPVNDIPTFSLSQSTPTLLTPSLPPENAILSFSPEVPTSTGLHTPQQLQSDTLFVKEVVFDPLHTQTAPHTLEAWGPPKQVDDPWGGPMNAPGADPWSHHPSNQTTPVNPTNHYRPASAAAQPVSQADPWANAADPWGASNQYGSTPSLATNGELDEFDQISNRPTSSKSTNNLDFLAGEPFDGMGKGQMMQPQKKTAEAFLGENSALVNLDNLVSSNPTTTVPQPPQGNPVPQATVNPFTSTPNAFQPPPAPRLTVNQLRTQQQYGSLGVPYMGPPSQQQPPYMGPPSQQPYMGPPTQQPYMGPPTQQPSLVAFNMTPVSSNSSALTNNPFL